MNRFHQNGGRALIASMLMAVTPVWAAEPAAPAADPASTTASSTANVSEIEQLKRMLIEQQRQIDELKRLVVQQKNGEQAGAVAASLPAVQSATPTSEPAASAFPPLGQVASTAAMIPRAAAFLSVTGGFAAGPRPPSPIHPRIPARPLRTATQFRRFCGSETCASCRSGSWISPPCGAIRTPGPAWARISAAFRSTTR